MGHLCLLVVIRPITKRKVWKTYLDRLISHYRKARNINPDQTEVHSQLGELYDAQGCLEEAIASYCRAIALNPYLAPAYHKLGQALEQQGGGKEKHQAIACYRHAIELESNLTTSNCQTTQQPKTTKEAIANPGNTYPNITWV